jgi:hypothetical protein
MFRTAGVKIAEHAVYFQFTLVRHLCKIAKADVKVGRVCPSVHPFFLLSTLNNSAPTGWIFMKFDI